MDVKGIYYNQPNIDQIFPKYPKFLSIISIHQMLDMFTEMHTGLLDFKFWAVLSRQGWLNKSPNLSNLLKKKSDQKEAQLR